MSELKVSVRLQEKMQQFIKKLGEAYSQDLVSVILYGSAASAEFVDKFSNLNILVVLMNTDLDSLSKASDIVKRFDMINSVFFTENYINSSMDVFPIEFLDMQDNYRVLYGKDILKGLNINLKNLRFQCEQELKEKLLHLKHAYIRENKNKSVLRKLLLRSFTSVTHILRNALRLKGIKPSYNKEELIAEFSSNFSLDKTLWLRLLEARKNQARLSSKDIDYLFSSFVAEIEKLINVVDKL